MAQTQQNIFYTFSVIMNSLSQFSRWNRFRLLQAKQNTPEPTPAKTSIPPNPKSARSNHSNNQGLTPQARKVKDVLNLTIKHQNRSPSHQESSSLSTKYNLPHNRFRINANHSKNKAQKQNSLSFDRFISGGKRIQKRHKINYSILQRIRQTLELYPNIAHEFKHASPKIITFATQSEDEGKQSSDGDAINLQKLVLWRESKLLKTTERIYEFLMQRQIRQSQTPRKKLHNFSKISIGSELKHYLMHRYKTQKLCKQNFINLLYSLYYYSDKAQYEYSLTPNSHHLRMKIKMLVIFEGFITMHFNQDDLIFYLYSRNIFAEILGTQNRNDEIRFITGEQVRKFLHILANGDTCIIRYYEQYLIRNIAKEGQGFEVHQVLYLLLNNFQGKKSRTVLKPEMQKISHKQQKQGKELSDLTLKQQGLSCSRLNMAFDHSFWKTEPPEQSIPEALYQKLLLEMGSQTKKLMSYFHSQPSPTRDATAQLILIKAIRMLNAVHRMDKYRWFEEMQLVRDKVLIAKGRDFEEIENLQKQMRGIQESQKEGRLERKRVVQFTKKLLTVKAFVDKLEELFEVFENCEDEQ